MSVLLGHGSADRGGMHRGGQGQGGVPRHVPAPVQFLAADGDGHGTESIVNTKPILVI